MLTLIPTSRLDALTRDPVTNVYIRAAFGGRLERRAKRSRYLWLLDSKGLGAINKEHGEQAGDEYLRQGVAELQQHLQRNDDLIFRWQYGDLFVVFTDRPLPEALTHWNSGIAPMADNIEAAITLANIDMLLRKSV